MAKARPSVTMGRVAQGQHSAYIVIAGPGHDDTRLSLREGITSFGRLPANDVILLGDLVSRHHSRITFFEGRATLQDLGSHNGSWVNGEQTSSKVLRDGDLVRVGNFEITFRQGDLPGQLDETTAGEKEPSSPSISDGGADALLGEIDAARQGSPSPPRAVHFLYRASDALARAPDARAYATSMLELALEHAPSSAAAWLRRDGRRLRVEARVGPEVESLEVHVPAVEWVLEKRFPVRSDDLGNDGRFVPSRSHHHQGVAVVPLLSEEASTSALYLSRDGTGFTNSELGVLTVISQLMQEGLRDLDARQRAHDTRLLASIVDPGASADLVEALEGRRPAPVVASDAVAVVVDLHGLPLQALPEAAVARLFDRLGHLHTRWLHTGDSAAARAELLSGHRALFVIGLDAPGNVPAALDLALQLRLVTAELCTSHPEIENLHPRVGVAAGSAYSGVVTGRRFSHSIFGPAPFMAARLVDAAGPGRVLVDQSAAERAGPGFELRQLGPLSRAPNAPVVLELLGR